jgi:hypothetical protein
MGGVHYKDTNGLSDKWLSLIAQIVGGLKNDTGMDFSQPHLRPSVASVFPLFVFLYALVVIVGTGSNLAVIWTVIKRRLYRNPTYGYIINLAIADIVKCVVVLPISLTILLVQNWIFGSFLCYFLPMLQVGNFRIFRTEEVHYPCSTHGLEYNSNLKMSVCSTYRVFKST